jgi:hypothetical protein
MAWRTKQPCGSMAELAVKDSFNTVSALNVYCSRMPGHDGECSVSRAGAGSFDRKRVDIPIKLHWPSPKMLRRAKDR